MHKTAFSPSLHKTCLVQGYCMWLSSPESCWRWSGRRSWRRWAGICPWTGRSSSCPEHRHSCLFQWDPQTGWVWKQRRDQVTQTGHLHLPQTRRNITTNPCSLMVVSALECGSQNHGFKSCQSCGMFYPEWLHLSLHYIFKKSPGFRSPSCHALVVNSISAFQPLSLLEAVPIKAFKVSESTQGDW